MSDAIQDDPHHPKISPALDNPAFHSPAVVPPPAMQPSHVRRGRNPWTYIQEAVTWIQNNDLKEAIVALPANVASMIGGLADDDGNNANAEYDEETEEQSNNGAATSNETATEVVEPQSNV